MSPKVHKYYNLGLQLLIGVLAYAFLYKQLFLRGDFLQIQRSFQAMLHPGKLFPGLILLIVLMLINWGIEALKWKKLMQQLEKVTFNRAFLAVFTGITASFFTPNRTGEFIGRVFILDKANRIESSVLTIVGSLSQLIVTLIIGMFSLLLFLYQFTSLFLTLNIVYTVGLIFSCLTLSFFLILALYQLNNFANRGSNKLHSGWKQKFYTRLAVLNYLPSQSITYILLLSLCRYLVFTLQAYLLLKLLSLSISMLDAFVIVSLVFFVLTAIPTIALSELGIRSSVAVFLFGFYERNQNGYLSGNMDYQVMIAFSLLWIINIALPAIIGSLLLGKLHFFRDNPA